MLTSDCLDFTFSLKFSVTYVIIKLVAHRHVIGFRFLHLHVGYSNTKQLLHYCLLSLLSSSVYPKLFIGI